MTSLELERLAQIGQFKRRSGWGRLGTRQGSPTNRDLRRTCWTSRDQDPTSAPSAGQAQEISRSPLSCRHPAHPSRALRRLSLLPRRLPRSFGEAALWRAQRALPHRVLPAGFTFRLRLIESGLHRTGRSPNHLAITRGSQSRACAIVERASPPRVVRMSGLLAAGRRSKADLSGLPRRGQARSWFHWWTLPPNPLRIGWNLSPNRQHFGHHKFPISDY